jgi:hypothetical protein
MFEITTKVDFDVDSIMKQVEAEATQRIQEALEKTKREMGPLGEGIVIGAGTGQRDGDTVSMANVSFPSEEIKAQFMEIFGQKMQ